MRGNSHVRCEVGENLAITSKDYLSLQDRLIALHHLDIGWKPSDVGRILRTFKIKKNVEVTDNGKIII